MAILHAHPASTLRAILTTGLLAALLIAPGLWFHHPLFGPFPPIGGMPVLPPALDWPVYGFLVGLLALTFLVRDPQPLIAAWCALFALRAATDMAVWQPYLYQLALMLLTLVVPLRRLGRDVPADVVLGVNRLIVAVVYLSSGLHKLNQRFLTAGLEAIPGLRQLLGAHADALPGPVVSAVSLAAPALELAIGVGLLTKRGQAPAALAAIAMHALLLVALGPLGADRNRVVWPWNVVMMLLVALLFLRPGDRPVLREWRRWPAGHRAIAAVVAIGSFLGLFERFPPYLAFNLYSFRHHDAGIFTTRELLSRLPAGARAAAEAADVAIQLAPADGEALPAGRYAAYLPVADWSEHELHAFVPPQAGVYDQVFAKVCRLAEKRTDAILVLEEPPDVLSGEAHRTVRICPPRPAAFD